MASTPAVAPLRAAHNESKAEGLPIAALLALAMTGFICIMTETLPSGLLPQVGAGLSVSQAWAGQMVTAYAAGSLIAAIPLTIATRGWRRRNALLLAILGFLVFNSITAASSSYLLTLVARFCAGASAGLAWSLLAAYARRMVQPHQQGKALALAMVGTPVALSVGVPLGTLLGVVVGWRCAFWIMSAFTLCLIVWVLAKVPDHPGQDASKQLPVKAALAAPGVTAVLGVVIAWMLAHNILYTYIAPFVAQAGLRDRVDLVLLTFGVAALAGIAVTGRLVDTHLRTTVLGSLAAFAAVAGLLAGFAQVTELVYGSVAVWGLSFGGAATLLQTALANAAGESADVALSMNVVAWTGAIAGGGVLGGLLLNTWGPGSLAPAVALSLAPALLITWFASTHGFPRKLHAR